MLAEIIVQTTIPTTAAVAAAAAAAAAAATTITKTTTATSINLVNISTQSHIIIIRKVE